jgi:hypothetical protein
MDTEAKKQRGACNQARDARKVRPEPSEIVCTGVPRDVKGHVDEAVGQYRPTRIDMQIVQVLIHEHAPRRLADEMHRGASFGQKDHDQGCVLM